MQPLDQLSIDTPEQIALELSLAGIGSRFLALTLDTLLQAAAVAVAVGVVLLGARFTQAFGGAGLVLAAVGPAIFGLFLFCVYWGYFAFFEAAWKGQTPGKRYAGIRVIKESGRPINAFEAIARNLMRAVDVLPGVYGVGVVTMMLNRRNRRLGDFVAGTVVIHETATEQVRPYVDAGDGVGTLAVMPSISADELVLVETYLSRRYDLDPDVREKTAVGIATRILRRTGFRKDPHQSPDDFLEALAKRTRDGARFR